MQARADFLNDVRIAVWSEDASVKKVCKALEAVPRLASPRLPPKKGGDA